MFFFFNDTATTEIYTLSLHDALPISGLQPRVCPRQARVSGKIVRAVTRHGSRRDSDGGLRSEEHTSELQSRLHLVCRLLLEKKKTNSIQRIPPSMTPISRPRPIASLS